MTKQNPIMRKVGPLPVWAWAALALVGAFLYLRSGNATAGTTGIGPAASGASAQQPASGQGSPADNGSADLLAALGANLQSSDALLTALQSGAGSGGMGVTAGGGSGGGASTTSSTAPTVVGDGSPPDPTPAGMFVPVSGTGNPFTGGAPGGVTTGDPEHNAYVTGQSDIDPFHATPTYDGDALSRYLANTTGLSTFETPTTQVAAPTPTVVQPAPVDTGGVIVQPRPVPGHNVAA